MSINNEYNDRVRYTFYHESIGNVEIAEPIGFNDDDLEYSRNKDYHGIFTLFSNSLEFYDESYDIIRTFYDTYGIIGRLQLKKEVLEEDTSQVNTMLWVEESNGFLDFTTYVREERKITCRFNSSGLSEIIKSRESIEIEIDRTTTLDGSIIPSITKNLVTLTGRDTLILDQSIINGTQIFDTTDLHGIKYTPLTEVLGQEHDDFSEVTNNDPSIVGTNNFFWVHSQLEATINVSISAIASSIPSGATYPADPYVANFHIEKWNWNGANYNFVQTYNLGDLLLGTTNAHYNYSVDIPLALNDSLMFVYESSNAYTTLTKLDIDTSESTSYIAPTAKNPFVLAHELLNSVVNIITDKSDAIYSEYFGRTNLGYSSLGIGAMTGFISGFWLRNFNSGADRYKAPLISWKDLISSFDAILNIGFGVEKFGRKEKVVIEDKKYFYQNIVAIKLPNQINNVSREVNADGFYNEVEIGFSKSGGYENSTGLDEPNGTSKFSTFINITANKYSKVSKVRGDSNGKEGARRKPQIEFPAEDTQYDDYNWFLDIKESGGNYTEKLWDDRFAKEPTGIFSPNTLTGLYFSPINCMLRHSWWFTQGFERNLYEYTRFASSTANSYMSTQLIGEPEYRENQNIINFDFERPKFIPEKIKFQHVVDSDIKKLLKGKTLINGREVPNVYCLIEFINEEGKTEQGYLESVKPNGLGEWELIKANTQVRRSQVI